MSRQMTGGHTATTHCNKTHCNSTLQLGKGLLCRQMAVGEHDSFIWQLFRGYIAMQQRYHRDEYVHCHSTPKNIYVHVDIHTYIVHVWGVYHDAATMS